MEEKRFYFMENWTEFMLCVVNSPEGSTWRLSRQILNMIFEEVIGRYDYFNFSMAILFKRPVDYVAELNKLHGLLSSKKYTDEFVLHKEDEGKELKILLFDGLSQALNLMILVRTWPSGIDTTFKRSDLFPRDVGLDLYAFIENGFTHTGIAEWWIRIDGWYMVFEMFGYLHMLSLKRMNLPIEKEELLTTLHLFVEYWHEKVHSDPNDCHIVKYMLPFGIFFDQGIEFKYGKCEFVSLILPVPSLTISLQLRSKDIGSALFHKLS